MDRHDHDREEIDRLVRELTAQWQAQSVTATASQPPAMPESAPTQVAAPVAANQGGLRPGSRWTNVRLHMPSRPAPSLWERFAPAFAISLPQLPDLGGFVRMPSLPPLPDLGRFVRTPGPVTLVRMWVALGAIYSTSITFWPYPKTYLWGMVLYVLSLGLLVVTGVWGARLSWEARLGAAHTIAVGTVLWAVTLVTVETLALV